MLVNKAQAVDTLSPTVENFLTTHKEAFFDLFGRQIQLIKSRSQAFEDSHITVFDKTLLNLTQNGNKLDVSAAINYYCEEYLNINLGDASSTDITTLQDTVKLPKILNQGKEAQLDLKDIFLTESSEPELVSGRSNVPARLSRKPDLYRPKRDLKSMEPRLAQLWAVFEGARDEHLSMGSKDDQETMRAAKFLRDTTENILIYLENKNADRKMLTELESTFNMAQASVVSLSGGKKRKFDRVGMDKVKGTPRGPSLWGKKARRVEDHGHPQQYQENPGQPGGGSDQSGIGELRGDDASVARNAPYAVSTSDNLRLGSTTHGDRGHGQSRDRERYRDRRGPRSRSQDRHQERNSTRDSRRRDDLLLPDRERRIRPRSPSRSRSPFPSRSRRNQGKKRTPVSTSDSSSRSRSRSRSPSRSNSHSHSEHGSGSESMSWSRRGRRSSNSQSRTWTRTIVRAEKKRKSNTKTKSRAKAKDKDKDRPKIPMRGRGHSGVPYGYSRAVDSYHPSPAAYDDVYGLREELAPQHEGQRLRGGNGGGGGPDEYGLDHGHGSGGRSYARNRDHDDGAAAKENKAREEESV